jgi:hypothetical protein
MSAERLHLVIAVHDYCPVTDGIMLMAEIPAVGLWDIHLTVCAPADLEHPLEAADPWACLAAREQGLPLTPALATVKALVQGAFPARRQTAAEAAGARV